MSLTTNNKYGKISISDDVVAVIASITASECYGVVDLVSRRFSYNFTQIFIPKIFFLDFQKLYIFT